MSLFRKLRRALAQELPLDRPVLVYVRTPPTVEKCDGLASFAGRFHVGRRKWTHHRIHIAPHLETDAERCEVLCHEWAHLLNDSWDHDAAWRKHYRAARRVWLRLQSNGVARG